MPPNECQSSACKLSPNLTRWQDRSNKQLYFSKDVDTILQPASLVQQYFLVGATRIGSPPETPWQCGAWPDGGPACNQPATFLWPLSETKTVACDLSAVVIVATVQTLFWHTPSWARDGSTPGHAEYRLMQDRRCICRACSCQHCTVPHGRTCSAQTPRNAHHTAAV